MSSPTAADQHLLKSSNINIVVVLYVGRFPLLLFSWLSPPYLLSTNGYQRFWLQTPFIPANVYPGPPIDYATRWQLPSGISCNGGCVMQL